MAAYRRTFDRRDKSSIDDVSNIGHINGGTNNSRTNYDNSEGSNATMNQHKEFNLPGSRSSNGGPMDRNMAQTNESLASPGSVFDRLGNTHGGYYSRTQHPPSFTKQEQTGSAMFHQTHRSQTGHLQHIPQQQQSQVNPQKLLQQQIHQLRDIQSANQGNTTTKQQPAKRQPSPPPAFDGNRFSAQQHSNQPPPPFHQGSQKFPEQQHSKQSLLPPPFYHQGFQDQHQSGQQLRPPQFGQEGQQLRPPQFGQEHFNKPQHSKQYGQFNPNQQQHPVHQPPSTQFGSDSFTKQPYTFQQPTPAAFNHEQFLKQQNFTMQERQPPFQHECLPLGNTPAGIQGERNLSQPTERDGMKQNSQEIQRENIKHTSMESQWQPMRSDQHQPNTLFEHSDTAKQSFYQRQNMQQSMMQGRLEINQQVKEENTDQIWVDNWCKRRQDRDRKKAIEVKPNKPKYTISEFKQLLKETIELNDQLLEQRDMLVKQVDKDESTWQFEIRKANKIKEKLAKAQAQLHDAEQISLIRQKLDKLKKKRESSRRKRQRKDDEKEEVLSRREELHKKFDEKLAKEEQKKLDKKREKLLQKEIDETFFDIRQKNSEANKVLTVLKLLRKLRQVRKDTAGKRGYIPSPQSTRVFEVTVDKLEEIMKKQRDIYTDEEKTMQVMMDFKKEEDKERERELQRIILQDKAKKIVRTQLECLFGKEENVQPNDPLLPYREYYLQAENNFQSLLDIRHQWDTFLVPDGTPGASTIPIEWVVPDGTPGASTIPSEWVVPTEASSETWATCLEKL